MQARDHESDPGVGERPSLSIPVTVGLLAGLLILGLTTLAFSPVWEGELFGPDAYSRLNRIEHSIETGDWSNSTFPRTNAPFGETIQWTRPLDVILLVLAAPLAIAIGWKQALFVVGAALGPILYLCAIVAVIWIASASSDTRRGLAATGFLFVTQVRTINPFLVARPDHHSVILFLFIMHLGVLAWAWSDPDRRDRFATIAGAIGAFSVWLSPEGLTAMVPGILWLGGLWVLRGSEWERPMRRYGLAAFAVTVVAWLVDPPPPGRLTFEFDRLSIAHVILFGVLGAVAVGLTMRTPATLQARVGSAAGAGVLAAGVLAVAMPKVFSGPMVDVPDDLWPFFLDNSAEWASMFEDGFSLRLLISRFGLSFLALGGYVWRFRRGNHLVALMAITHLTFIGLSLQQLRWETYLGVLDALALAWLFGRVLERFDAAPRMINTRVHARRYRAGRAAVFDDRCGRRTRRCRPNGGVDTTVVGPQACLPNRPQRDRQPHASQRGWHSLQPRGDGAPGGRGARTARRAGHHLHRLVSRSPVGS